MQEKIATVDNNKVRYLEEGRAERTVLLVHGLGGSGDRWLEVIPKLSKHYRVIAPDLIGFGHSDKPSTDYTIEFFSNFVYNFLNTLGIRQTTMIGTSLGGQIVADCAATYNHIIEKMILVAPSGAMKRSSSVLDAYVMAALYPNQASARNAFELMTGSGRTDENTVNEFVKRMSFPNAKLAFISSILGIRNSTAIGDKLRRITTPTLVIWGKEDKMIPIEYSKEFLCRIPNSGFVEMTGCGHTPHVEEPQKFSDIVLDFLNHPLVLNAS